MYFVKFIALICLSCIQKKMDDKGLFGKYTMHEGTDYRGLDAVPLLAAP